MQIGCSPELEPESLPRRPAEPASQGQGGEKVIYDRLRVRFPKDLWLRSSDTPNPLPRFLLLNALDEVPELLVFSLGFCCNVES